MHPIYTYIRQELTGFYPDAEASAMAKHILTEKFHMSTLDLYTGKDMNFSSENMSLLNDIINYWLYFIPRTDVQSVSVCPYSAS